MTCEQRLMAPFAAAIFAKAEALRELDLTKEQKKIFRESISGDIQKASNLHTRSVSEAACLRARSMGIERLVGVPWHKRKTLDGDGKTFHFEHKVTVSEIRARCLGAETVQDVCCVLVNSIDVVWILKDEDRELRLLGFQSKRPPDAYTRAGIQICTGTCCAW